ncbi:MAG: DoxX family protein [Pseudolabrys sp.]|jgi:putative oxidoreductase
MNGRSTQLYFPGLAGFYASAIDFGYLVLRVVIGIILFVHGFGKLKTGVAGIAAYMAKNGLEPGMAFAVAAMFLETVGAACVAIGLFTRFFAAALAIEMLTAFLVIHLPKGFAVGSGGYEYVLLIGVVLFSIALRGGGRYSVDQIMVGKEL